MQFTESRLRGAFLISLEPVQDERGFFARAWCRAEFEARGLDARLAQCNLSFNPKAGTLRGLHYQSEPFAEAKLVRCTRGAMYDVILDLRAGSESCRQWFAAELSAENRKMLYIPAGVAHGFLTLADATEVFYQMSEFHHPECARGVRWNDPAFAIPWPAAPRILSERDRSYPDWLA